MERSKQKYVRLPEIKEEELIEIVKGFKSKRVLAASIIFDLLKKFGISLFAATKLLPTWRQL